MSYWVAFEYCLAVTMPVFLIVFLGCFLRFKKHIDDGFVASASSLVFNICLPLLIFFAIIENEVSLSAQWPLVVFCMVAAVLSFLLFWVLSSIWVPNQDRGVVVQGAFRSNLGIIGIALCAKAFGGQGLAIGAVMLSVVTPIYNVLSVYALNFSQSDGRRMPWSKTIKDIARNPLIIAIALGLVAGQADFKLPKVLYDAGTYLANMTLPLALIAIGGAISVKELRLSSSLSIWTVVAKLWVAPVMVVIPAYWLGFRGVELGCILLMFASPTATASFIMVRAMGGNYQLASNIIVLSTLLSVLSISVLLYLIKLMALI